MNKLIFNYYIKIATMVFFSLVGSIKLPAQNSNHPDIYNGISEKDKIAQFIEEFDSNANEWGPEVMHTYYYKVDTGFFYLNTINTNLAILKETNLNISGDFEIESEFMWISCNLDGYFGLHWGINPILNHEINFNRDNFYLSFLINETGDYFVEESGDFKSLRKTTGKLSGNSNLVKLTIRKMNNILYFFINEEKVYQYKPADLFGRFFGFQAKGFLTIKAGNFKIWKIEKP